MTDAHSFTWHGTGQNLLEAKLRAIDAARFSVCLETFNFRDSDVDHRFRSALAAAPRRGVRVRLIVDAVGWFGLGRDYFAEPVPARLSRNQPRTASVGFPPSAAGGRTTKAEQGISRSSRSTVEPSST